MRIGLCSTSYDKEFKSGRMELFDWMTICARDLKLHGVEIAEAHFQSTDEDYIKAIRRVAVDLHLDIPVVSMMTDFGQEDEEQRNAELERVERALKVTHELGAPILRIHAGSPADDKDKEWETMTRCMEIACLLAERDGIVIAVENLPGGFIGTSADISRLLADVDSDWLRINLDTGNFDDGWESIEKSVIYAVNVHAKMNEIEPSGMDFTTDYPAFIKLLKEINYRAFINLEYCGSEDAATAVPRGLAFLRRLAATT